MVELSFIIVHNIEKLTIPQNVSKSNNTYLNTVKQIYIHFFNSFDLSSKLSIYFSIQNKNY